MRRGFVSGKVTAPDDEGISTISMSVVDLETDTVYEYTERALSGRAFNPRHIKSEVLFRAAQSIQAQYKYDNGL